jgi:hypothetical protein
MTGLPQQLLRCPVAPKRPPQAGTEAHSRTCRAAMVSWPGLKIGCPQWEGSQMNAAARERSSSGITTPLLAAWARSHHSIREYANSARTAAWKSACAAGSLLSPTVVAMGDQLLHCRITVGLLVHTSARKAPGGPQIEQHKAVFVRCSSESISRPGMPLDQLRVSVCGASPAEQYRRRPRLPNIKLPCAARLPENQHPSLRLR